MELRFCDIFQARFLYVQTALLFTNTIIPYRTLMCRLIWCYTHVNQTQDLLIWQNSEVTLLPTPGLLLFLTDIIYCIRCLIY